MPFKQRTLSPCEDERACFRGTTSIRRRYYRRTHHPSGQTAYADADQGFAITGSPVPVYLVDHQIRTFLRQSIRATFGKCLQWGLPACGHTFSGQIAASLLLPEEGDMVVHLNNVCRFENDYTRIHPISQYALVGIHSWGKLPGIE
jgi:hypothetical protein